MPKLRCNPAPVRYLGLGFPTFEVTGESEVLQHWTAHVLKFDDGLRIAACWNACDGIPTEILEQSKPGNELFSVMKAQRDELLAALKQIAHVGFFEAQTLAQRAIRKVEGSERERGELLATDEIREERQHIKGGL